MIRIFHELNLYLDPSPMRKKEKVLPVATAPHHPCTKDVALVCFHDQWILLGHTHLSQGARKMSPPFPVRRLRNDVWLTSINRVGSRGRGEKMWIVVQWVAHLVLVHCPFTASP